MNQDEVINAFKPDFSRKHGCAWFVWGNNAVHQPEKTGGWASIGGEPAFSFQRPQDLPKDVVWWTNLTKSESWSLGRWSHIKHAGFLGPDWLTLMSEWGVPQEIEELKTACSAWSEVLARLAEWLNRWSVQLHEDDSAKVSPLWTWGDGDFHEALAEKLNWSVPKDVHHPALAVAYCDVVEQEIAPKEMAGKRKISLALPPVGHAQHVLATRYPVGEFAEVSAGEWPTDPQRRWEWLAQQTAPVLVRFDEVYWAAGSEDLAALWWGLRGRRFAGAVMDPVWMTAEEALEVRPWIDSAPVVALRAKGWTRFNDVPHWPHEKNGFLFENSITLGLLHTALWQAAATPVRTATKRIKSGVSPRTVWWRAADRRMCFAAAKIFHDKKFTVLSYGQGCVTVLFDNNVLMADWLSALTLSGVKIPHMLAVHINASSPISSHGVDVWLKSSPTLPAQTVQAWLMLDRLLWPWLGHEQNALRDVLAQAIRVLGDLPPPNKDQVWSKEWKDKLVLHSRAALKGIVEKKQ